MHHFYGAAGETECHGPERALPSPVGDLIESCPAERVLAYIQPRNSLQIRTVRIALRPSFLLDSAMALHPLSSSTVQLRLVLLIQVRGSVYVPPPSPTLVMNSISMRLAWRGKV